MGCEARQELLGAVLDGEAVAVDHAELFAHLGGCAGCRSFFDTLVTVRAAAARDRDALAAAADAIPLPVLPGTAPRVAASGRVPRGRAHVWRLPAPLAAALAVALLTGGMLLGARWSRVVAGGLAAQAGRAPVVVICSLPEVMVR